MEGLNINDIICNKIEIDWNKLQNIPLYKQLLFILFKKKYNYLVTKETNIPINEFDDNGYGFYTVTMDNSKHEN